MPLIKCAACDYEAEPETSAIASDVEFLRIRGIEPYVVAGIGDEFLNKLLGTKSYLIGLYVCPKCGTVRAYGSRLKEAKAK